ncbi:MAG: universal stress protein, partial [Leucobacter sp.]
MTSLHSPHTASRPQQADTPVIIVGVTPGQPTAVVSEAARFADRFGAELVCASVDAGSYEADRLADGSVVAMPIDSDLAEARVEQFDPRLRAEIAAVLDPLPIRWSTRALAGGAAQQLSRLADELGAEMIVVGTCERGVRGPLHEFFNGSVAVQLAHHQ